MSMIDDPNNRHQTAEGLRVVDIRAPLTCGMLPHALVRERRATVM